MGDVTREDTAIPQWDQTDRLRKALRHANLDVQQMADYLEVHRNTVSNWLNGRIAPSGQTLRLWATRCEVDLSWLRHGDGTAPPGPGPDGADNRAGPDDPCYRDYQILAGAAA